MYNVYTQRDEWSKDTPVMETQTDTSLDCLSNNCMYCMYTMHVVRWQFKRATLLVSKM